MKTDDEVKAITERYTSGEITYPEYRQELTALYRLREDYRPVQVGCSVEIRDDGKPAARAKLQRDRSGR